MEALIFDFFLRTAESFYDRETVQGYFQLLVQLGYRLRVFQEKDVYRDVEPEITSLAQQAIDEYLTRRLANLELRAYYLGNLTIECWITLRPEKGAISFVVTQEHFSGSDEGRAAFLGLIEMFKETYRYWHPIYGYQWYDSEAQLTQAALLATHEVHHIYPINFWGPEIVEKLGRERVLNAPAWRKEVLADGGVLLIPDNTYDVHIPFAYRRLATVLGLQTPQDPDEEWFEDIYDDPAEW
jgi:hypothetical protein